MGHAATNRLRSYAEELSKLENQVEILIFASCISAFEGKVNRHGVLNGVNWYYASLWPVIPKYKILRGISKIWGQLSCLCYLRKQAKANNIDIIIIASSQCVLAPLFYRQSRLFNALFALENSEYPNFVLKRGIRQVVPRLYYQRCVFPCFDLFILMTKHLIEYHKRYGNAKADYHLMPMTVDLKRFELPPIFRRDIVSYIGVNSIDKDGVRDLISAFAMIADKHPGWILRIIGDTGRDLQVKHELEEKGIIDKVVLMGNIHRDEVPRLLCGSKILALARPSSKQAEGGFPTKLGEYLATGNLVVLTATGEIQDYLRDMENAIVVRPDDPAEFARRLSAAIADYNQLADVRANGRKIAETTFNASHQAKLLSNKIRELIDLNQSRSDAAEVQAPNG